MRRSEPSVIDWQQISKVQSERFPELPMECGERAQPGIVDADEWRDWSELETTAEQLRIEDYLDRLGVRGKSILNVGIGKSGLARRFSRHASIVIGTTIEQTELDKAGTFALPNYRAILHNKYSGENDSVPGPFDFIVDDGPTTFCCCFRHLALMLDFYASKLAENGQVIIERRGLGWTLNVPWAKRRWGFSFDDIAAVAPAAGLTAYQVTKDIYVLARSDPARPTFASLCDYYVRRLTRKLWRAATLRGKLLRR